MGRRMEMPPQCFVCGKNYPQYGDFCKKCLWHKTWLETIHHAWDPNQVRIQSHLYVIQPEPPPTPPGRVPATGGRGFGGATFRIRFADGRVVTTNNLWSVGDIPEEYQEALPDNAHFLSAKGVRKRR